MSLSKRYADVTYSPADLAQLTAVLSEAQALTKPLPSEETVHIKHLAKIGLKSESFAHEALDVARAYPTLLPVGLNVERMAANLRNRDLLQAYMVAAEQVFARIRAALVLHGVDAYADGLTVYKSLQHNGDEEVREVVQKLGRIFKQKGRRKKKQGEEGATSPGKTVSPAATLDTGATRSLKATPGQQGGAAVAKPSAASSDAELPAGSGASAKSATPPQPVPERGPSAAPGTRPQSQGALKDAPRTRPRGEALPAFAPGRDGGPVEWSAWDSSSCCRAGEWSCWAI